MNVRAVGEYIRSQRKSSRLSLRKMSGLAGVSMPYLSQVERGLRKPSAEILQAIAKGLRISAETLYVQAGILEDRPVPDVASAIMGDQAITERHKQALVQIYEAFRDEAARAPAAPVASQAPEASAEQPAAAVRASRTKGASKDSRRGGGAKSLALTSPHPAPLRSSARTTSVRKTRKEV